MEALVIKHDRGIFSFVQGSIGRNIAKQSGEYAGIVKLGYIFSAICPIFTALAMLIAVAVLNS